MSRVTRAMRPLRSITSIALLLVGCGGETGGAGGDRASGSTTGSAPLLSRTMMANADGRLELFARGGDGALWHTSQLTPGGALWSSWQSLGGVLQGNPAVTINIDHHLEVFYRGTDNQLWHLWQIDANGNWSSHVSLGGQIVQPPVAAVNVDGRIEVFVKGTDQALWHIWQINPRVNWSSFVSLGGVINSDLSVVMNVGQHLEVFYRGGDNQLWHLWQNDNSPSGNGSWQNHIALGGQIVEAPVAAVNADGRLEVFVKGTDNGLWHIWQIDPRVSWSAFTTLGGVINSDLAVTMNIDQHLEVFYRGTDNQLWHLWQQDNRPSGNGNWVTHFALGGQIIAAPLATANSDGRLEVFVIGTDSGVWHTFQVDPRVNWSPFDNLGNPTGSALTSFQLSRISQHDIDQRAFTVSQLNEIGDFLFNHPFSLDEGLGNGLANFAAVPNDPLGTPLAGPLAPPNLRRVHHGKFGGPDDAGSSDGSQAKTCNGCHNVGGDDGGGDLAHTLLQDGDGLSPSAALARNGRSLLGGGYIQQLGIEMTAQLIATQQNAKQQAVATGGDVRVSLGANGVSFGTLVAHKDGTFDSSGVVGVDADLIVKPHGWKGRLASLRRFVEGGFQVHFGMQSEVFTTKNCAKPNPLVLGNGANCNDPDNDGVTSEITEGQLTAMSIYAEVRQAPIRVNPTDPTALAQVQAGEQLFSQLGCASCHTPRMTLLSPIHQEVPDLTGGPPLPIDLTVDVEAPRLARNRDGTVTVELFSDLKRHEMGASLADPHPTFGVISASQFLTPPLWGVASTPPYLHDGRAPDLATAVRLHDGEGAAASAAFQSASADGQAALVAFLQTLSRAP